MDFIGMAPEGKESDEEMEKFERQKKAVGLSRGNVGAQVAIKPNVKDPNGKADKEANTAGGKEPKDGDNIASGKEPKDGDKKEQEPEKSLGGLELDENGDPIKPGTAVLAGATTVMTVDLSILEPTDLLPPKWLGYGAALITDAVLYVAVDMWTDKVLEYKKVSDGNSAAQEWGYGDAHELKDAHGVGSHYDIYRDGKTGDGVLRPRKGTKGEEVQIHPKN